MKDSSSVDSENDTDNDEKIGKKVTENTKKEQNRSYVVRYSNWQLLVRFLLNLTTEEVLKCFEFEGGILGKKVVRNLKDMFKVLLADYKLPKAIQFMCGKRFGSEPKIGYDLDTELFKNVLAKYIRPNQSKYDNGDRVSLVSINMALINAELAVLLASTSPDVLSNRDIKSDFQFSAGQARRFNARWYISRKEGILVKPPQSVERNLPFTEYAISKGYDKETWAQDTVSTSDSVQGSDSLSSSSSTAATTSSQVHQPTIISHDYSHTHLPSGAELERLMDRNDTRNSANPYVETKLVLRKFRGVEANVHKKTFQAPVMKIVYQAHKLAELVASTGAHTTEEINKAFRGSFVKLFISGTECKSILDSVGEPDGLQVASASAHDYLLEMQKFSQKHKVEGRKTLNMSDFLIRLADEKIRVGSISHDMATTQFKVRGMIQESYGELSLVDAEEIVQDAIQCRHEGENEDGDDGEDDGAGEDQNDGEGQGGKGRKGKGAEINSHQSLFRNAERKTIVRKSRDGVRSGAFQMSDEQDSIEQDETCDESLTTPDMLVIKPVQLVDAHQPSRLEDDQITANILASSAMFQPKQPVQYVGECMSPNDEEGSSAYDYGSDNDNPSDDHQSDDEPQSTTDPWSIPQQSGDRNADDDATHTAVLQPDLDSLLDSEMQSETSNRCRTAENICALTRQILNSNKRKVEALMAFIQDEEEESRSNKRGRRFDSSSNDIADLITTDGDMAEIDNDDISSIAGSSMKNTVTVDGDSHSALDSKQHRRSTQSVMNAFYRKVFVPCFELYGHYVTKLNASAHVTYVREQEANGRKTRGYKPIVGDASPTQMWFHIINLNSSSESTLRTLKSSLSLTWELSVVFNIHLEWYLRKTFNVSCRHAVVEVEGDGTCLMNAILTNLYLRKWFRDERVRRGVADQLSKPLITAHHLKRWTMFYVALHSQDTIPNHPGQTFMSLYKMGCVAPGYLNQHPYNVVSYQDELNDLIRAADSPDCKSDTLEFEVAAAIRLASRPPPNTTKQELESAALRVVDHFAAFKACRQAVFQDMLEECTRGMMLSTHSEELQLTAVWDLLQGLNCSLYTRINPEEDGFWMTISDNESDSPEVMGEERPAESETAAENKGLSCTNVLLMKSDNHYYTVLDLEETKDDFTPSVADARRYEKVTGVWDYPAMELVNLENKSVVKIVTNHVVKLWRAQDKNVDISIYDK